MQIIIGLILRAAFIAKIQPKNKTNKSVVLIIFFIIKRNQQIYFFFQILHSDSNYIPSLTVTV